MTLLLRRVPVGRWIQFHRMNCVQLFGNFKHTLHLFLMDFRNRHPLSFHSYKVIIALDVSITSQIFALYVCGVEAFCCFNWYICANGESYHFIVGSFLTAIQSLRSQWWFCSSQLNHSAFCSQRHSRQYTSFADNIWIHSLDWWKLPLL